MASIKQRNIGEIALTTGSTVSVSSGDVTAAPWMVADDAPIYRVTGTETLSVSDFTISITAASGPTKNTKVDILWEAVCTPASNDVIIAGATIPQSIIGGNFKAECTYNGSAWVVMIFPDWEVASIVGPDRLASDSVTTAKIADDAVTLAKLASGTKGDVTVINASGNPAALNMAADGELLIGETATGGSVQAISGVITLTKAGVTAFAAGAVTDAAVTDVAGGKITGDGTIPSTRLSDTGILASGFADVGTAADTVKVTALTGSIALGTLDDGDIVQFEFYVEAANTATVKTIRLEVDGAAITMNTTTTSPDNIDMMFKGTIQRASNTSALVYGTMVGSGGTVESFSSKPTITNFDTTAVPILCTIQNGTANLNDIVFKGGFFKEGRG